MNPRERTDGLKKRREVSHGRAKDNVAQISVCFDRESNRVQAAEDLAEHDSGKKRESPE
jgi:hypothetical protein